MFESIQARIVAFTAFILLLASFVAVLRNSAGTSAIMWGIFGIFISLLYFLVIVLDQNCVVVGGCDVWGWIKMLLTEIWLVFAIILTISAIVSPQSVESEAEAEAAPEEESSE